MKFSTLSLFSIFVATIAASPIIVTTATSAPARPPDALVAKCPPDASFATDGTCVCSKSDQHWDGPISNQCCCLQDSTINKNGKCVCKDPKHKMNPNGSCTYHCPLGTAGRGGNDCACTQPYTTGGLAVNDQCSCNYGPKRDKAKGRCDLNCPKEATYNTGTQNCDCPAGSIWGGPRNNICRTS